MLKFLFLEFLLKIMFYISFLRVLVNELGKCQPFPALVLASLNIGLQSLS